MQFWDRLVYQFSFKQRRIDLLQKQLADLQEEHDKCLKYEGRTVREVLRQHSEAIEEREASRQRYETLVELQSKKTK